MSIKVMSLVWSHFGGGGSELLAMLALADWADDHGRCFPGMAAIGRKVRLGPKQARRVVHSLIDAGWVDVIAHAQGGNMSRHYRLRLDRLTPPTEGRPPIGGSPPAEVLNLSHGRARTPPASGSQSTTDPSVSVTTTTTTTTDKEDAGDSHSGDDLDGVHLPHHWPPLLRAEVRAALRQAPPPLRQQLADELAGAVAARVAREPLPYLHGLVRRARAGTYTPLRAQTVAAARLAKARPHPDSDRLARVRDLEGEVAHWNRLGRPQFAQQALAKLRALAPEHPLVAPTTSPRKPVG